MIVCDLCGETRECLQKNIEGQVYDICSQCWNSLARKLRGKGRMKENPKPSIAEEQEESPRLPGDY